MFSKILIANRGEIACRIIRTCRRLGVATVAVYSDADRNALHRRLADEAFHIGGAAPGESYLRADRILEVARATGAEAIHPGYGFLSEKEDFAEACANAGVVFIGPSVDTICKMGSKADAKATMEAAGVPCVPGYHGEDQDLDTLVAEAEKVGFPLMIKAAAGGGGKGMRIVRGDDEFKRQLESARREAAGAFGDDRVILERYVELPRHIEVQVFGDTHGNVIHLLERDCSAQRRYQKVIEEAPAPGLDDATRTAIGEAAVNAAKAVDYCNAGTVEFIMGADGAFFFMEMNTRLQVEHPVTEMVTGHDLVEWQLRVASGEALPASQEDIKADGHAIEARVYAEDAAAGFLPSTGRLDQLRFPSDARIDTGVDEGQEVTVHYDPMIAKIIVHGANRRAALGALTRALQGTAIAGPKTNIDFLLALANAPIFSEGRIHTAYLDAHLEDVYPPVDPGADVLLAATAAALWDQEQSARATQLNSADPHSPWARADGWRPGHPGKRVIALEASEATYTAEAWGGQGNYRVIIGEDADAYELRDVLIDAQSISLRLGNRALRLPCLIRDGRIQIGADHRLFIFTERDPFAFVGDEGGGGDTIVAPMPGKIIAIETDAGAQVSEGDTLIIMEAMKMELALKAPRDGEIAELKAAPDDFVEADTVLATLTPLS